MWIYIVLCDMPIGYNGYCETEIVGVFKYQIDAEECADGNENYRIEEWYVKAQPQTE